MQMHAAYAGFRNVHRFSCMAVLYDQSVIVCANYWVEWMLLDSHTESCCMHGTGQHYGGIKLCQEFCQKGTMI